MVAASAHQIVLVALHLFDSLRTRTCLLVTIFPVFPLKAPFFRNEDCKRKRVTVKAVGTVVQPSVRMKETLCNT